MKLTLSWLNDFLKGDYTLDDVTKALIHCGLEVESVIDEANRLKDFVIGEIISAEKHPDADKLKLCKVNDGKEILQIVCGAPNARVGLKTVLARLDVIIPATCTPLKKGKIRGIESFGMMCSFEELLLPGESHGIIELHTDLPAGHTVAEALGLKDPIIDVSVTPNRADCFSILGIARDLYAYFHYHGKKVSFNTFSCPEPQFHENTSVSLNNGAKKECQLFGLSLIENVDNAKESPKWLQERLLSVGLRSISPLVDVTNYCCFHLGRPLHVFDADKVKGKITLRLSQKGEEFDALDDKTYTLDDGVLVICDDEGIISLAGIMGGKRTCVDRETKNVFLESAYFDPVVIAKGGQALNIISDSRMRFERGVDPALVIKGMDYAINLITEISGGKAQKPLWVEGEGISASNEVSLSLNYFNKLVGLHLPASIVTSILTSLGFKVIEVFDDLIRILPPSWRQDVTLSEDLIEEVVRIYGVDNIPARTLTTAPISYFNTDPIIKSSDYLVGQGYHEVISFSFISEEDMTRCGLSRDPKEAIYLENPITEELKIMRPTHIPSLLKYAKHNLNYAQKRIPLFEIAPIYNKDYADSQKQTLTALFAGKEGGEGHWQEKAKDIDTFLIKSHLMRILSYFNLSESSLVITRDVPSWYHPMRAGAIKLGKKTIAYFGDIHPKVLKSFEINCPVAAFEVFIDDLPKAKGKTPKAKDIPAYQVIDRDFAFVYDKEFDAGQLYKIVLNKVSKQAEFPKNVEIKSMTIFDIFQANDSKQKSIAFKIVLQPLDRTLNDEEIKAIMDTTIKLVEIETGGVLR